MILRRNETRFAAKLEHLLLDVDLFGIVIEDFVLELLDAVFGIVERDEVAIDDVVENQMNDRADRRLGLVEPIAVDSRRSGIPHFAAAAALADGDDPVVADEHVNLGQVAQRTRQKRVVLVELELGPLACLDDVFDRDHVEVELVRQLLDLFGGRIDDVNPPNVVAHDEVDYWHCARRYDAEGGAAVNLEIWRLIAMSRPDCDQISPSSST